MRFCVTERNMLATGKRILPYLKAVTMIASSLSAVNPCKGLLNFRLRDCRAASHGSASLLHSNRHFVVAREMVRRRKPVVCRGLATGGVEPALPPGQSNTVPIDPIPEGIRIEVKPEDGTKEVEYDEANKVVRIPLSAYGPEGQRRSKLVMFTCNKCGARTARLVNPVAWEKGVVFGQCSKCGVWHVLAANNKKIFEEVRYKEDPEYRDDVPAKASNGAGDTS